MIRRHPTGLAATAAAIGLVIASCGGSGGDDAAPAIDAVTDEPAASQPADDAPAAAADADAADGAVDAVPAALQFSAPLVGGGEIDATTLAGKPTAFWFWAPT